MARFLIEVPHPAGAKACKIAIHTLLSSGSHYITHADWGCLDGDHKAWLTVDVDNKEEARCIVPPAFRAEAKVVQLSRFTLQDLEDMLRKHPAEKAG